MNKGGTPETLRTPTSEEARAMQLKGAKKRKENHAKKILMSQIYADFLAKKYNIKTEKGTKKITGAELVNESMKKIIASGGSPAISMMKEMREAIDGIKVDATAQIGTNSEEMNALYESIMNDNPKPKIVKETETEEEAE